MGTSTITTMMPGFNAFASVLFAVMLQGMYKTAGAALAEMGSNKHAVAPGAGVCHPGEQGSQAIAPPAPALVPLAHAVHALAPFVAAYVPGAHATHVCTPLPSTTERYPASHKHAVAAFSIKGVSGLLLCWGHCRQRSHCAYQYVSALQYPSPSQKTFDVP